MNVSGLVCGNRFGVHHKGITGLNLKISGVFSIRHSLCEAAILNRTKTQSHVCWMFSYYQARISRFIILKFLVLFSE